MANERVIRRGEIYYYNYGNQKGSLQSGERPVMIVQCNEGNDASSTTVIAAITTASKNMYLPCHVFLGENYGLKSPSTVLLEQITTINQNSLQNYIGFVDDKRVMKAIDKGLKKSLGIWIDKPKTKPNVLCLCKKCLDDYIYTNQYIIRRLDPFTGVKDKCDKCNSVGYDYIVKRKNYHSEGAEK